MFCRTACLPACFPLSPPGLLEGDCAVVMDAVAPGEPQVFTFSVPPGGASSLVLGLAVQGGTASM